VLLKEISLYIELPTKGGIKVGQAVRWIQWGGLGIGDWKTFLLRKAHHWWAVMYPCGVHPA